MKAGYPTQTMNTDFRMGGSLLVRSAALSGQVNFIDYVGL